MQADFPVQWVENRFVLKGQKSAVLDEILPQGTARRARDFHRQIPGYRMSPLKGLNHLAAMLGVGGIWVKDESARLSLNSFKVLGGSYAIYHYIKQRLGLNGVDLTFNELMADDVRGKLGDLTFCAATDGNHGRGVAWAARSLGCKSVIYVHKFTSQARIKAIESNGAEVIVVDGTYDDAVRRASQDAERNGWQVISDTSWEGYEDIPKWVMQGYTTMLHEAQEQLAGQGIAAPTHVFMQAGVGALAAAAIGFYAQLFGADRPITLVVEPDKAACLFRSAQTPDGQAVSFPGNLDTIMAGLACGEPSPLAWRILRDCTDYFLACPDYVAAKGMRVYAVPLKGDPFIVSGESGAVTLGALMFILELSQLADFKEKLGLNKDSQILLVNSEGNTDPNHFRRVVWDGATNVPSAYKEYH